MDYSPFVKWEYPQNIMNFSASEIIPLYVAGTEATKRADAVANRQLLLRTAQRLFAEQGAANVCMTDIAEAAGVGKGTLYRQFAHKGELCLSLLDEDMRQFQDETLRLLRENYDQPALNQLDSFLARLVYFMDFHAVLIREAQLPPHSPQTWLPWLQTTLSFLLAQAQACSETGPLDIPYLIDAILAPLRADLFIYQREILGFELERISLGLRRLVLEGCRRRDETQGRTS
jgi:AcrR family transcriptional regulator